MSSWALTKYKTTNWSAYNKALKRRGSLSIWFDAQMEWAPPPSGKRGRQQQFSDAAIQTCLTLKVLFGMPLRQTTGFVESLLKLVGLNWAVPDFSTLCRRQKTLNVSLPYRGGTGPLNLLIDSTGIKSEGEGEWNARKHGGSKRRIWRKIQIGIDEETLEVRAVEVTSSNIGDAPILPELLDQIPSSQTIGSVTAEDLLNDGFASLMQDGGNRFDVMAQMLKATNRLSKSDWSDLAKAAAQTRDTALGIIDRKIDDPDAVKSLHERAKRT